ncbi:MAG TPA: PSD1 and planctomycete cytochrome C domain-containing protein [Pirellulales bacterium]|jgi:mono/diheme cytochrome c family protein
MRLWCTRLVIVLVAAVVAAARAGADEPAAVDFAGQIRPLFEQRCYKCHGGEKQISGYRLDVRSRALAGGESGETPIVPGKPADSPLIARLASDDKDLRMPPEGERVSPQELELVRRWIGAGAPWPDELAGEDRLKKPHWAFQAPTRGELPTPRDARWARSPIDQFVLARLESEGLAHSPEADRVTMLRRLSLDLIGLPPTIADVDTFLADRADGAYERAVERLLASPHYGERWGRHWLDAARYADSDGYEKDKPRQTWFYRDWVVGALNRDLPYDQFVIEQIAGDLLPNASQDQIVATGFLRNSMTNEEGGIDPEQFRMEAMFDRMDAVGKSILGLTIQCAQCHNHKFDPLTQEDYYRTFALLNDAHEANIAAYTPDEQMHRADVLRQIAEIEADLKQRTPDWTEQLARWEAAVRDDQPNWVVVQPEVDTSGGEKHLPLDDGSILAQGYAPTKHTVQITARTEATPIGAFRLELLTDPNLPLGGPGRSVLGTAALSEFNVEVAPANAPEKKQKVKLVAATADVNPSETPLDKIFDDRSNKRRITGPIAFAIDGNNDTAWCTDNGPGRRNQPRKAVFVVAEQIVHEGGTILTFSLLQNHGGWNSDDNQNYNLGRFRFSVTAAPAVVADPLPAQVRQILAVPSAERSPRQLDALFSHWRTTVPTWQEANARIEELWRSHPAGASQLALLPRDMPRETHLLKRGDFLKPDRVVTPGVPGFLHPLAADQPATRLSFARWLVDRRSPTTARALVNRVWQAYFGTGLVATSEDLGTQSEAPSHPQLLDWLAVDFMERGWSLKQLHRLIVTSATYRQASRVSPELLARDPYNRLLARGARFRVEGEVVRDVALAASGLLSARLGGPSVFPPLPEFMLLPPVSYGPKTWPLSTGEDRHRRALYTFRYRSLPYPVLQTFDAPNGDFSCVRRVRSNTPLQALATLNEPVAVECAQALARRTLTEAGQADDARLTYAFRLCVARAPTLDEAAELSRFYVQQKERLSAGWLNPWQLLGPATAETTAPTNLPEGSTPTELAAWTAVARVLLNLDETITKE